MIKVYKQNVIEILKEFSDIQFQRDIWLNLNNPENLCASFIEAANELLSNLAYDMWLPQTIVFTPEIT